MKKVKNISKRYYLRQIVACFLVSCLFFNTSVALATPSGANVVAGQAAVGQTGNTTTVSMGSASAVINWNSLDTSSSEILQFIKASGGFAVLNRIIAGGATHFDGSLFGNQGHIFIVNPSGIIFGPTSYIQASKFTAAGLNIADRDFMSGHYEFVATDGIGTVSNYGHISARQVALIGKQVTNAGVIRTPGGYTLMAAGDRVFLGQEGSDIVVEVDGVTVPAADPPAGLGDVINEGTIEAAGGKVVLAAGDTFSRAIEGLDSLTVAVDGGTGRVGQFGTISTDGIDGDGGSITLTAADVVALGPESVTTANAGANGDGGEVIVYSPDTALFRDGAQVEAKGGAESGGGGFFELSGKQYVEVEGQIDLTAADGRSGEFLIDPLNILIYDGTYGSIDQGSYAGGQWEPAVTLNDFSILGIDRLEYYLGLADLTVTTDGIGGGTQDGWVIFDAGRDVYTDPSNDNSLTVNADDFIMLKSGIDFDGDGDVALNAGTSIIMNVAVDLAGGSFTADAGAGSVFAGSTLQAGGSIELSAGDNAIELQDNVTALTGNLVLNSSTAVGAGKTLQAGQDIILAENKSMLGQGALTLDAGSDIMLGVANPLTPETGSGGSVHANGDLTLGAGDSIYAHGTLTTTHVGPGDGLGNIELSASDSTIYLFGDVGADVTDDGDIIINNNAWVADGKTLAAGENVTLEPTKTLTGEGDLAIIANTGRIQARDIIMPAATTPADPHTLQLVQNAPLSMEDGEVWVYNRDNTNLVAVSTGGGVTSEAADQWRSVSAAALGDIILNDNDSGSGRNMNAGLLRSISGNVEVTALHDKILALGPIDADTGSVLLAAPDGIELYANVTSGLSQDYNGDVELKDNVTAESTGGSDITFAGTVDGAHELVVKTAGVTRFEGEVGGKEPLAGLVTDAGGGTRINGGSVSALNQVYGDQVTLGKNTTLYGLAVQFLNTLNSDDAAPRTLLVNAVLTVFGAPVGGIAPLASLETDDPGSTWLLADVTTTGHQTYGDGVYVSPAGGVVTAKSTNGGDITFAQTVDSLVSPPTGLNVETSGVTKFQGQIGGTNPLASLTTDAPGHTEIGSATIGLSGSSATFNDPVLLTNDLVINEAGTGDIEFAGTVDSAVGNNYTLTVNSGAGATIFGGAVGSDALDALSEDTGLGAVTTNAAGTTQINGGSVTTTLDQTYNDPVTLGDNTTLNGTNVTFGQTLDSDSGNKWSLLVNAGGVTKFNGVVGGSDALSRLETDDATGDDRTEIGAGTINLDGASAKFGDPVLLTDNLTINEAGSGDIEFAGTVDSAAGNNYTLTVNSGDGATIFGGAVGSDALDALSEDTGLGAVTTNAAGTTQINGGSVTTTLDQTYNDPVTLGDNTTLNGTNVTFDQTLDSDSGNKWSLLVNAGGVTRFNGVVGGTDALSRLETDDATGDDRTEIGAGTINLDGASAKFGDPVLLTDNLTINEAGSGDIEFAGTVDSAVGNNYTLTVNSGAGTTIFGGAVGSDALDALSEDTGLGAVTTNAAGHTEIGAGTINLNGSSATFNDPVLLTDDLVINEAGTGNIEFASTVDSAVGNNYMLTVNSGAGTTIFGGAVGSDALDALSEDTGLGAVTTNAAGTTQINGGSVTTTWDQTYNDPVTLGVDTTLQAGHNIETSATLYAYGSLIALAGNNIKLEGPTETVGNMKLDADNTIKANRSLTSGGKLNAEADTGNIILGGPVQSTDILKLNAGNNIKADKTLTSSFKLVADAGWNIELGDHAQSTDNMNLYAYNDIRADKSLTSTGGKLNAWAGNNIEFGGHAYSEDTMNLYAYNNIKADKSVKTGGKLNAEADWNIQIDGDVESIDNMNLDAGNKIEIGNKITSNAKLTALAGNKIIFHRWAQSQSDMLLDAENDVYAYGDLISGGDIEIYSSDDTTFLYNDYVMADGSILLNNNTEAAGDIIAGENVTTNGYLRLIGGLYCDDGGPYGHPDQVVQAENGTLTANSWVRKVTEGDLWLLGGWDSSDDAPAVDLRYQSSGPFDPAASTCLGNLWIEGVGDVQISGDLTTFGECYWCYDGPRLSGEVTAENGNGDHIFMPCRPTGGVAVISQEGKIYTQDGINNDTLQVSVTGSSDHWAYDEMHDRTGLGVDLPHGDGKAAILISSKEDLKIGENAELAAYGKYYDDVDDRAGMNLLDTPAAIGGIPRKEGEPFDVAIYAASTGGNVDVSSPVTIMSCVETEPPDGIIIETLALEPELEPKGAMVIDAFDSVTFGPAFEDSLKGDGVLSDVGDRLEVVSRISEWLFQAIGKLPYVGGGGPFVPGYDYVLRGAGLGNPAITDGRAWVLENPLEPAPLHREYGEEALEQELEGGCPVLMQWLAAELGVPEETIQIYVANTFAYATDIQPCEACARLFDAANTLADDASMTALAAVVNEYVTTPAPPSDEQMALIANALTGPETGTTYASAARWIDALVAYVTILSTEMGWSPEQAVAFAGKYVTPISETGNVGLMAYVEARLAALGG
ncbi:MAG: beta strand repeat-containing protein [Planctomycetota bacterium]|jgi:filamentous hemagglutinin family protein